MEENQNKNDQKSNLSFFEPTNVAPDLDSSMKKIIFILVLGSLAGLISALVAHMLASTISIMFWALTENGNIYFLVLYGQLFVYTVLLYIFSYIIFRKWDHTTTEKVVFLASYFLLYIIMFIFYVLQ